MRVPLTFMVAVVLPVSNGSTHLVKEGTQINKLCSGRISDKNELGSQNTSDLGSTFWIMRSHFKYRYLREAE